MDIHGYHHSIEKSSLVHSIQNTAIYLFQMPHIVTDIITACEQR